MKTIQFSTFPGVGLYFFSSKRCQYCQTNRQGRSTVYKLSDKMDKLFRYTLYNSTQTTPDKYTHLNFMLNKLIKLMCTDDIDVVLDGNCFDEVVAVEEA